MREIIEGIIVIVSEIVNRIEFYSLLIFIRVVSYHDGLVWSLKNYFFLVCINIVYEQKIQFYYCIVLIFVGYGDY